MKKAMTKRALSLVLAITLLFSAVAVFGVSANESANESAVEIVSQNVYYGDTLKLMYAVKAEGLTSSERVSIKLYDSKSNEIETITKSEKQTVNGVECFVFISNYGVPAQSIDTEVYAKAIVTDASSVVAESATLKYSVLEYLYERLTVSKDNGKVTADQEAMYEGLIEYAGLAEKVLTNKTENEKIANYSYVSVKNGTVEGDVGAIFKKGEVVNSFTNGIVSPKYSVIWQIDEFTKSGDYIDSYVMTDAEFMANGYTVTENNVVISARENSITEADVLAQIATFGNPSNPNTKGSTYTKRGCVRFSFPIKAGTTFKLKEEYQAKYKIAMNYTTNPEYKDTAKYPIYDLGWDADNVHTTEAKHDGLYPVICFTHRQDSAFTQDEIESLVTMLEVTGEKATLDTNRGKLTDSELERQIALYGSVPMPNALTRQRVAFAIKMQAGAKVSFVGDSALYNWAVVELSNTGSTSYMFDTGWNSSWSNPNGAYVTQINGSYLALTIKKIDGSDLTHAEIDKLTSMFKIDGYKYYDNGVYSTVAREDYAVTSVNHRGYVSAPENTLEAYRLSALNGFNAVECDVSFTKDGYAVLLHDGTVDRTSNGTGNITSLTLAEVKALDFGSWKSPEYAGVQIPTFEEFIALCKELDLHPYIELKSALEDGQAEMLVGIVEKYGLLDGCTWISFKASALEQIKGVDEGARLGYLVNSSSGGLTAEKMNDAKALRNGTNEVFLDLEYGLATAENVELCRTEGFAIEVWTVDKTDVLNTLNEYVSGVTSNFVVAGKYLEEKNAK